MHQAAQHAPAVGKQRCGRAEFEDAALAEHNDDVEFADVLQAMHDEQQRARQGFEGPQNQLWQFSIFTTGLKKWTPSTRENMHLFNKIQNAMQFKMAG